MALELYPYQKEGLEYLLKNEWVLLADEMGCVDGDTRVTINRGGCSRSISLRELYQKFNGISGDWRKDMITSIRCLYEGEFRSMPISSVVESGIKSLLELETVCGKRLYATPDHRILTPSGYKELGTLNVGEDVIVNGKLVCKGCGSADNVATYARAKFVGYCRECIYQSKRNNNASKGRMVGSDGYIYLSGTRRHPHYPKKNGNNGLGEHRLVLEALKNKVSLQEWVLLIKEGKVTEEMCLPRGYIVHHKDGDRLNNTPTNLELLTTSQHHVAHKKHRNTQRFLPKSAKIKSIRSVVSQEMTYDITVPLAENFVAEGIVVHNCGKSAQAIALLRCNFGKAVVVCPASLIPNWEQEIAMWSQTLRTCRVGKAHGEWDVALVSYNSLAKAEPYFAAASAVIADEVQALCNPASARTGLATLLLKRYQPQYFVGLSGTPVRNRVSEFWSLLNILGIRKPLPKEFKSHFLFCRHFAYETPFFFQGRRSIKWRGLKNEGDLKPLLAGKYLRRTVEQVTPDLPPIIRSIMPTGTTLASAMAKDLKLAWEAHEAGKALPGGVSSLKKDIAILKAPLTAAHTVAALEEEAGPVVVATDHPDAADAIAEAVKQAGFSAFAAHGKISPDKRAEQVAEFQSGKLDCLVCSYTAMGTGITLTKSNLMFLNDLCWVPGDLMQMEKRINRIGQLRTCFVKSVVLDGLDKVIAQTLQQKQRDLERILR
jgi:hypothetical protein